VVSYATINQAQGAVEGRGHWGGSGEVQIARLNDPGNRGHARSNKMIEGGQKPFFPAICQAGQCLPGKVGEPVSEAGTRECGTGPAPLVQALFEVGPDRLPGAANPAEMGVGTQGNDVLATGTSVAPEIQTAGKAVEVPRSEAVPPEPVVVAAGTDSGPSPRIILALLKNILEKNRDKIYHVYRVSLGQRPRL